MRLTADRMQAEAASATPTSRAEDDVGHTVRFIRAAERGLVGIVRQCLQAFPRLSSSAPAPLESANARGRQLQPYRQLAVDLAREAAIEELSELQRRRGDWADSEIDA
eukprot:4802873-Pyramimonas_sp.AAC.1